jgi:branched-chain amino acid transport system permease protein
MLGAMYALVSLGLTLVYGILHVPDFSHGSRYMFGAYVTYFLVLSGLGYWWAMLVSMAAIGLVGLLVERLVFYPLRGESSGTAFIAAFGLLLVMESLILICCGAEFRRMSAPYEGLIVRYFGITLPVQRLIIILTAAVLITLIYFFIEKTKIGAAIQAVSQDREGAALLGINVDRIIGLAFALAGALAAAAGSLIGPIFLIYPKMGGVLNLKAFTIVILGTLGSIPGAIIGSFILGVGESLGAGFVSADYRDLFAFGALVLVLAVKPSGLFGRSNST